MMSHLWSNATPVWRPGFKGRWELIVGLAALYFGAAKLGLTLAFHAEQVTVVWPPSGISLAAILLFGPRVWPGVALGAFLANATTNAPIAAAVGIAVGNTLEALCGAWLLQRFAHFNPTLHRLRDVLSLTFLAAGLSTMVSATMGVASLCIANAQPWASYLQLWWVWWLGDATSDLVVAPLLLTLFTTTRRSRNLWGFRRGIEAGTLASLLAILSFQIFNGPASGGIAHDLAYAVFPFVIWAALRFGSLGSAAVTILASALAIWGTVRGLGPFAREPVTESLILIQLFMAVVAVTGMFLAAAVTKGRRAERRASAQYAAARILTHAGTREEALGLVLECVRAELEWDGVAFWVAEESEGVLRLNEVCFDPSFRLPEEVAVSRGTRCARRVGLAGSVWATAKSLWLQDVPDENRALQIRAGSGDGCQGVLGVPVLLGEVVFGVMEFFSRGIRPPDEELLEMTTAIGRQIGQFIEKRSAAEALSLSRETLELAQEAAQASTFAWSLGTDRATGSASEARLFGLPAGGFDGKYEKWKRSIHPEDRQRALTEALLAAERRRPLDTEFRTVGPDGEVRWIAARGRVFHDDRNGPARMVGINIDITERKRAEQALLRSEERYRTFIQKSSEGIWRCELAEPIKTDLPEDEQIESSYRLGYLAECNDAMARMYGFSSAAEIVGSRLDDLLPRSDPHNIEFLRNFIRGGYRLDEVESHEVDRDANPKIFLNSLVGFVRDGGLVRAWGTQRDVTEQRRIERDLRKSEEKFRGIVETANEGIWILDSEARIQFVNERMAAMLGYQPEEMLGRAKWDFLFDADQTRVRELFENRRAGISEHADVRFRARDGREVWTIMSARPLSDDRGEFRGALDLFTDTTDRKQAEEDLRKSEEFRRRVLDSTRDRVEVLALDGSILSMNDAGLVALEIDELGSLQHTSWTELWQVEERESARQAIEAATAGRVGRFQGYLPTWKTHTPKWWDAVITPILDSLKRPVQLLVVSRDVTEQKRLEVALRNADRRKDEFLAMLAHELRNPISAITSAAELGLHPQISEQDLRWSQEIIQRQVKQLGRLVDDLLDVSRIIHGKIALRQEPLDAGPIIKQAIESVRPLIVEREHHFELVMPPLELPIIGDATRVEQIIVNLLTNAAKYTHAGGHIRLAVENSENHLMVKIRDTGVGIPPEEIAEMFELFSQGDRSLARSEGGLGIGLTLVKRLTEMHGGSVTAHSEGTGKGSEFVVRLPLAPEAWSSFDPWTHDLRQTGSVAAR